MEALDSAAFLRLQELADGNDDNALLARAMVRTVKRTLAHDKANSAKMMPMMQSNTNVFHGPFTSEEIAMFLQTQGEVVEGAINWVSEHKNSLLLPIAIEAALRSDNLIVRNRTLIAVEKCSGRQFDVSKWKDFEEWWATHRVQYTNWPFSTYLNAMNAISRVDYNSALTNFLEILKLDPKADKSRALAVACYVERLDLTKAQELNTNYLNPEGRWPKWASAKLLLHTGKIDEGTTMLSKLHKENALRFGDTFVDETSHLARNLNWKLFNDLIAKE